MDSLFPPSLALLTILLPALAGCSETLAGIWTGDLDCYSPRGLGDYVVDLELQVIEFGRNSYTGELVQAGELEEDADLVFTWDLVLDYHADEAGGDEVEGIVGDCLDLRAYWNDEIWYDACDQTNIETFRSANFTLIWDGGDRAKYEDDFCEGRLRR